MFVSGLFFRTFEIEKGRPQQRSRLSIQFLEQLWHRVDTLGLLDLFSALFGSLSRTAQIQ